MVQPLLVQYYHLLPAYDPENESADWARRYRKSLVKFKRAVEARYMESTLVRLLNSEETDVRQAAILALGLTGTIQVNATLAKCLHDEDPVSRNLSAKALWSIWQRADTPENSQDLRRLVQLIAAEANPEDILAGFDALIRRSPRFAEAYNQRAIFYYHRGEYSRAVHDCEKALRLNPCHFGAASGMAQCFMKLKKHRAALRLFRRANRINPNLETVREAIQSLERMLGEDKK